MHGVSCMEIDIGTMNEVMRLALELANSSEGWISGFMIVGEHVTVFRHWTTVIHFVKIC